MDACMHACNSLDLEPIDSIKLFIYPKQEHSLWKVGKKKRALSIMATLQLSPWDHLGITFPMARNWGQSVVKEPCFTLMRLHGRFHYNFKKLSNVSFSKVLNTLSKTDFYSESCMKRKSGSFYEVEWVASRRVKQEKVSILYVLISLYPMVFTLLHAIVRCLISINVIFIILL